MKSKKRTKFGKKSKEQDFARDCAEWVIINQIPLDTPSQFGFTRLLAKRDEQYHPINRHTIATEITKIYNEAVEYYRKELNDIEHMSSTTDVWTAENSDSYSSLSVSYIDKNWVYNTLTLACTKLEARHTGKDLSGFLIDQCSFYKIYRKV